MRNKFSITGDKKIDRKLKRLEAKEAKQFITKGLKSGAKIILSETKLTAPVDEGTLKSNFKVRAGKRSRKSITREVRADEKSWKGDAWYAAGVELGFPGRGIEGQHFMKKAFDKKKDNAKQETIREIKSQIDNYK